MPNFHTANNLYVDRLFSPDYCGNENLTLPPINLMAVMPCNDKCKASSKQKYPRKFTLGMAKIYATKSTNPFAGN